MLSGNGGDVCRRLTIRWAADKLTLGCPQPSATPGEECKMREFAGKTAFITGAASGIGLALARTFLDRGMNVMMADVEDAALAAAVHALSNFGDRVASVRCDVAIAEELAAAAA